MRGARRAIGRAPLVIISDARWTPNDIDNVCPPDGGARKTFAPRTVLHYLSALRCAVLFRQSLAPVPFEEAASTRKFF
jgi:hypothetical protein